MKRCLTLPLPLQLDDVRFESPYHVDPISSCAVVADGCLFPLENNKTWRWTINRQLDLEIGGWHNKTTSESVYHPQQLRCYPLDVYSSMVALMRRRRSIGQLATWTASGCCPMMSGCILLCLFSLQVRHRGRDQAEIIDHLWPGLDSMHMPLGGRIWHFSGPIAPSSKTTKLWSYAPITST
jgi:hypothetical protein